MSIEEAIARLKVLTDYEYDEDLEALEIAIEALEQQPCDDCISRQAVIKLLSYDWAYRPAQKAVESIKNLPPVKPQEKTEQFAKWVATEIFDDMWKYNKDAFAEIACRKLAKLGIVRAKGDEWELVEPQESEDKE